MLIYALDEQHRHKVEQLQQQIQELGNQITSLEEQLHDAKHREEVAVASLSGDNQTIQKQHEEEIATIRAGFEQSRQHLQSQS